MGIKQVTGFIPVVSALLGNTLVTIIKLAAALASGSSSMFAETVHSFADTLNQALLLLGLGRSLKKPDARFEYGYGNERFFWALVSACGIFFVGAGVAAYNAISTFSMPHTIEFSPILFIVLSLSLIIEFYTFLVAAGNLKHAFPEATWGERLALADSSTLAVFLEDAVAVLGIIVASISIGLSYYTGNPLWDALGSMFIAALLVGVAVTLIIKNRSYLIGHAMPTDLQEEVIEFLQADPAIEKVIDFKSVTLGFRKYRIKCEVEFNGTALFREAYQRSSLRDQFEEVKDDFEEFKRFSVDYADRIPRLMGKRIDEIEGKLRKRFPSIWHIDIEIN